MRLTSSANVADRAWLEKLIYNLIMDEQLDFGYALHNVQVVALAEPFAAINDCPIPAMTTIEKRTGQLSILLYWPIVSRLSVRAQMTLLKHEVLHIIEGHLSQYGFDLIEAYGQMVANIATDVYVNQIIDRKPLIDEGLPGVGLEDFPELAPRKTSHYYAEQLSKTMNKVTSNRRIQFSTDTYIIEDPLAGTSGTAGDEFTGRGVPGNVTGVIRLTKSDAQLANERSRTLIQNVAAALEASNKAWSRGVGGADHETFLAASKRDAEVPWSYYLRAMETKYRSEVVTPTRSRPSRRHPAHQGRVRRGGLSVVFLIDTSGSMGEDELKLVEPELRGLHARGAEITVIHCDSGVAKVERYNPFAGLENFYGRGGTDYSDAFLHIRAMLQRPGFVVGFTDGWGCIDTYKNTVVTERGQSWWDDYVVSDPEVSPDGQRSLWIIPDGCMSTDAFKKEIVPWGTAIAIKRDSSEYK